MVKHSVAGGDYTTRRAESEAACAVIASHRPEVKFLRDATLEDLEKWGHEMAPKSLMRARHVISENLRTVAAAEALLRGDMAELGRLMAEAHWSYSKDFEGQLRGGRRHGGAGAGSARPDRRAAHRRRLRRLHHQSGRAEQTPRSLPRNWAAATRPRLGIVPEIHICHASGGAHRLD